MLNSSPQTLSLPIQSSSQDQEALLFFKITLCALLIVKIIEVYYSRRQKIDAQYSIKKRFISAHGKRMIEDLTEQEKELMALTLKNTVMNAKRKPWPVL